MGFVHPLCFLMSKFQGNGILIRCLLIKKLSGYILSEFHLYTRVIYTYVLLLLFTMKEVSSSFKQLERKGIIFPFSTIFQEKTNDNASYMKVTNERRHWGFGQRGQQVTCKSAELKRNELVFLGEHPSLGNYLDFRGSPSHIRDLCWTQIVNGSESKLRWRTVACWQEGNHSKLSQGRHSEGLPCTPHSSNLSDVWRGKIASGLSRTDILFRTTVRKADREAGLWPQDQFFRMSTIRCRWRITELIGSGRNPCLGLLAPTEILSFCSCDDFLPLSHKNSCLPPLIRTLSGFLPESVLPK